MIAPESFTDRLFIATVTPYAEDSFEVDEEQYRGLLRSFFENSDEEDRLGIIAIPEAGEIYYLSRDEKRRLLEVALEEVSGAVPVLAGVSENTTADTVEAAREATALGVDGLFVMPPIGALDITASWEPRRYPEVLTDLLGAIAEAAPDMPLVCHPTGPPTAGFGVGLPADVAVRVCSEVPNVVAWKMTYNYNGYRAVTRALRSFDPDLRLYASSAPFYHEYLATGVFDGTATGALNYALEPMLCHIRAWRRGDLAEARRIWDGGLAELHEYVYGSHSRLHVRYKVATWLRGFIANPLMRPPLPKPRTDEVVRLAELLGTSGVHVISSDAIEPVLALCAESETAGAVA